MNKDKINLFLPVMFVVCFISCEQSPSVTKIAFGSCGWQDEPQPILALAATEKPDAFIFLGDNIYGDTDNMDTLRAKYNRWGAMEEFKKLDSATKIFATWDDHDFGRNDAGKWYPYKKESKEIFLTFFKEPAESDRRKHEGIYHSEYIKTGAKTIQVILLDVRTFRDDLLLYDTSVKLPRESYFYKPDYMPHISPDSTLLGPEQWQWLETELAKPADLRLICSGSQFSIEYNGYEAWANFPHEQKRMLELIKKAKANGVIFLTGDVHYAEISKLEESGLYPIYDITASGITSTWDFATLNKNRIEGPVMDNHFGLLTIEWQIDPLIRMEIIDKYRNSRIEYTIKGSEIRFK
ncbi:MAG TPA: alkaline phosphatase D family protein [Chitinophagaceae bacterium]|nr:alkaline phosphatase D family protein [Chitinophagaceae bacterium]